MCCLPRTNHDRWFCRAVPSPLCKDHIMKNLNVKTIYFKCYAISFIGGILFYTKIISKSSGSVKLLPEKDFEDLVAEIGSAQITF
jgi:hypothetical protein